MGKLLKHLIILFMFSLLCLNLAYSQIVKSMSVEFTKTVIKETLKEKEVSKELVKGSIYYQAPKKIVLKVTRPISQWMVFEESTMLIYYPNEQKAFRFISTNPFSLPFFQAFVGIGKDDFSLSKAGFTLARSEVKDGILLTYWKPPKQAEKALGNTIMGLAKDKLLFIEVQDRKGKTLVKTTYSNHLEYDKAFFPLEIASVHYQKNSSIVEKIVYINPQFNITLPSEVVNFKIPPDIEVKEIRW